MNDFHSGDRVTILTSDQSVNDTDLCCPFPGVGVYFDGRPMMQVVASAVICFYLVCTQTIDIYTDDVLQQ